METAFAASKACDHVTRYDIPYAPHLDGCVVSLWDAWNRFLRRVVLDCSSGATLGIAGATYSPLIARTVDQTLSYITTNKRSLGVQAIRGEPNSYRVQDLAAIAGGLGLANGSQIVGAIGLSSINLIGIGAVPNPLAEIQLIRNFIAHKNPASLGDIRTKLSAVSCQDVHGYLWGKTTGGVERFTAWMSSLRLIAEAACA